MYHSIFIQADVVFLSPPWGGPSYASVPVFDMDAMMLPAGTPIFDAARAAAPNIIYFLPRNTDAHQVCAVESKYDFAHCLLVQLHLQIASLAARAQVKCDIEQTFLNRKLKAITAYFGEF